MKSWVLLLIFSLISCSKDNSPNSNISVSPEESEIVRIYAAKAVTPTAPSNPVIYPSVTNDKSHTIALTIRNSSTEGELIMNPTTINFESLTLFSNGCPAPGLQPKSTCTIRFNYAAKDKPEGIYSGSVTIDGLEIPMQIPVIPAVVDSTVDVVPTPLSVDFGSLSQTSSTVRKTISYRNKLSKALTDSPVTFENNPSDFTIVSNSCGNLSAKGKCSVTLTLNPKGKNGTLENALLFAGTRVPLSAQVEGNPPPPVLVENITSNLEIVNFGDIQPNSTSSSQSVVFTNKSNIAINLPTVLVNNAFKIISDSCSNRQIAVNSNCTVRLVFSSVGQVEGPQTGTLSLGSKTVSLQANILSEEELADLFDQNAVNSNIVIEYLSVRYTHMTNPPELPSPYIDLGTKNQGDTLSLNITVRNIGSAPARITSSSFASNISIVSNSCSLLNPNTSCSIRGNLNSQTMANLDLSLVMTHETRIFPIRYNLILPNSLCTNDNALNNGVTDMNGVVSVSGSLPNCVVSSCNEALFEIAPDQRSCVDKPLACTLADVQSNGWNTANHSAISGMKTGSDISQCVVSSCLTNYSVNSSLKSCEADVCSMLNASSFGVTLLNVDSVSGNVPNCSVATCESNYKPAADSKSCVAKLCSELTAGELSVLGFNTTNATISGTFPSCTLACNSSLQQLTIDGKSCLDIVPTGSISFVQDYTRNLSGNLLNITQTNAQQIQFYSDSLCSAIVGSPLSMPLTQTAMNLSIGDGVKNVYAKLINGSASSSCLTDTIILDQTAPALAITSPLNNANIAGSSLTVTGTCSEVNSPTVQVGVTINSVTQNVNCSSGTFSSSFNIGSLAVGPYTISASATDLASNIGTTSRNFNRINCSALQTLSGNTCIDNTPTGSIAFVQARTNTLTGNLLNITQTNAQQIQFYSNASCTTPTGSALSMPISQTSINLSSGDGTKTAYAKLINGTASSSCLSSSIILDQTIPLITMTSPSGNPSIATANITVSGSCSDATSGINGLISISIDSVASSTQTVACNSGSYSLSYVLPGALSVGSSYTIRASITDNATNSNFATVSFVRAANRTLTINKTGTGTISSSPAGINCGSTCSSTFLSSQTVVLTATPSPGWTFSGWSGGLCSGTGTCSVTMSSDRTVSATFVETSVLNLSFSGTGSGTVTSSPSGINCISGCNSSFAKTSTVVLTATPNSNSNFIGWSGDCSGTGPCSVSMSVARNVSAQFSLKPQYLVSISKTGDGTGLVTSSPAGIDCGTNCAALFVEGSSITLTVTPGGLSSFVSWGGDCSGTSSSCTISNIMSAKNITANFTSNLKHNKIHLIPTTPTDITPNILPISAETPTSIGGTVGSSVASNSGAGVAVSGSEPTSSSGGIIVNTSTSNLISNLNQTSYVLGGTQPSTIGTCNLTGSLFSSNCTVNGSTFSVSFNKSQISIADTDLDLNINVNFESLPIIRYNYQKFSYLSEFLDPSRDDYSPYFINISDFMVTQHSSVLSNRFLVKLKNNLDFSTYAGYSSSSGIDSAITSPIMCGGHLYFVSNGGSSNKLFRITSTGGFQKTPDPSGNVSSNDVLTTVKMLCLNNMVYFRGLNSVGRSKLFRHDAVSGGTVLISNTSGSASISDAPSDLTSVGSSLYFVSNNSSGRRKLFRLSGSTISQVSNIAGSTFNDTITTLTAYGSDLYFNNINPTTWRLVKTNGTTINPIINSSYAQPSMNTFNSFLYIMNTEADGRYLYKYNGVNLIKLSKLSNNQGTTGLDTLFGSFVFNNELYFISEHRLHKITTSDEIIQISSFDFSTVTNNYPNISSPTIYNSELYFIIDSNLYKINTKGQLFLVDTNLVTPPPVNNISDFRLGVFDGSLYYNKSINSLYKVVRIKTIP